MTSLTRYNFASLDWSSGYKLDCGSGITDRSASSPWKKLEGKGRETGKDVLRNRRDSALPHASRMPTPYRPISKGYALPQLSTSGMTAAAATTGAAPADASSGRRVQAVMQKLIAAVAAVVCVVVQAALQLLDLEEAGQVLRNGEVRPRAGSRDIRERDVLVDGNLEDFLVGHPQLLGRHLSLGCGEQGLELLGEEIDTPKVDLLSQGQTRAGICWPPAGCARRRVSPARQVPRAQQAALRRSVWHRIGWDKSKSLGPGKKCSARRHARPESGKSKTPRKSNAAREPPSDELPV